MISAAVGAASCRLVKNQNLVAYWRDGKFFIEEFRSRQRVIAAASYAEILDAFRKPRSIASVTRALPYERASLKRAIADLCARDMLVAENRRKFRTSISELWRGSFAAAYYHFSTRDVPYSDDPIVQGTRFRHQLANDPQPGCYKDYLKTRTVVLSKRTPSARMPLHAVLGRRRTVRDFAARKLPAAELATLVRGTWGQTGWVDGGLLGPLIAKTSPSAGARHPIECYALIWAVSGIRPGLYHYGVRRNALERLRDGDFREEAVRFAGGQGFVRNAAFLCVMTAVADRVFWKYSSSDAYRLFFLDAGHLAQTFLLLATARNLGAFTTAAMKESAIEEFIGVDGVREFPVYLCGAGRLRQPPSPVRASTRRAS